MTILLHGLRQLPEQLHLGGVDGPPHLSFVVIFIIFDLLVPMKAGGRDMDAFSDKAEDLFVPFAELDLMK